VSAVPLLVTGRVGTRGVGTGWYRVVYGVVQYMGSIGPCIRGQKAKLEVFRVFEAKLEVFGVFELN